MNDNDDSVEREISPFITKILAAQLRSPRQRFPHKLQKRRQRRGLRHSDRKNPASSSSRLSTHFFRSSGPSASKKAWRTHRDTHWYQRVTDGSISRERAIVMGG